MAGITDREYGYLERSPMPPTHRLMSHINWELRGNATLRRHWRREFTCVAYVAYWPQEKDACGGSVWEYVALRYYDCYLLVV